MVFPVRVDARGAFLSYNLSHRLLSKRAASARIRPGTFYSLFHGGQQLRFNLSLNRHLLAPGFVSEKRHGGVARATIRASRRNPCHMIGSVQNQHEGSGLAALSTCDGLVSGVGGRPTWFWHPPWCSHWLNSFFVPHLVRQSLFCEVSITASHSLVFL